MRNRKLKRRLAVLTVPQYSYEGLENTIAKARGIQFHPEKQRMTTRQFFLDQIRFIRKEFWGMKLIFTAFLAYLLLSGGVDPESWLWTFVAISGPVLCLANANVLCDVYRPGMLELQMTVRNSLQKVLIFRLMVSGVMDLLAFSCGAAILTLWKGVYLWRMFLYAVVPYNLMCMGCLAALHRTQVASGIKDPSDCGHHMIIYKTEESPLPYCMAWGIAIVFIMILLKTEGYQIFEPENVTVWVALAAFSTLGAIREMKKLIRYAACKAA